MGVLNSRKWQSALICLLLVIVAGLHFGSILKYCVNILYFDEWEVLRSAQHLSNLDLTWLFQLHNEHRIVPTKLIIFTAANVFDLNYASLLSINYIIFLLIPIFLIISYNKLKFKSNYQALFILSLLPLFSTQLHENHYWAFQSCFHISVLCIFLNARLLSSDNWRHWWLSLIVTAVAIYSLATSIAAMAAMICMSLLWNYRSYLNRKDQEAKIRLLHQVAITVFSAGIIASYFIGYQKNPGHPEYTFPWSPEFWQYLLSMLQKILNLNFIPPPIAWIAPLALLMLAVVPILGWFWGSLDNQRTRFVSFAVLGLLAAMAVIAFGRAGFGAGQAQSSRYMEFAVMLLPLAVLIIIESQFLHYYKPLIPITILGIFLVCINQFNFNHTYQKLSIYRQHGLACVNKYYDGKGDGFCPHIYPANIADRLEVAKKLNLSFYRDWENNSKTILAPKSEASIRTEI